MARLVNLAPKIRSKNARPFWGRVGIFCSNTTSFVEISPPLTTDNVCARLQADPASVKRLDIKNPTLVKFSFI